MADIRTAKTMRQWFPAKYIGVLVQLLMGITIALGQSGAGGTVSFFQGRTHIDSIILGSGFILSGLIVMVTRRIRVYIAVNLFVFGSYTLVALYGWLIEGVVPPQAAILTMGVCLFTLWAFPEGDNARTGN